MLLLYSRLSDLFADDLLRRAREGRGRGGGGEIMTNYEVKLKTPRIVMDGINNRKQQI